VKGARKVFAVTVASVAILALVSGQGAFAGSTLSQGDSHAGQPAAGFDGAAYAGGCDTLDAQSTLIAQSNNTIKYACDHNADLTNWLLETTTHNGKSVLHAQWKVSGKIPNDVTDFVINPNDPNPIHTGESLGLNFVMFFQNKTEQNARQQTGDTSDCQQHTHLGPFLSGNGEWLAIYYSVNLEADQQGNPSIVVERGFAHYDPVGLALFSRPETGPSPTDAGPIAKHCVFDDANNVWRLNDPTTHPAEVNTNDPGSQVDSAITGGNTLDLWVPTTFHYSSLAPLFQGFNYTLAKPGTDTISNPFPQVQAEACLYCIPAVYDPTNPSSQLNGPSYLKTNPPIDWAPWSAYDLGDIENGGVLTVGTAALPGATCARESLFVTEQYRAYQDSLRGSYGTDGHLIKDTDNELQVNPLFGTGAPPTDGQKHYDSSRVAGLRDQVAITTSTAAGTVREDAPITPQDHNGPLSCDTPVPGTQANVGSSFSFPA